MCSYLPLPKSIPEMKFRVFDRLHRSSHIVGADQHDTFHIWENGQVTYYNYQTGEPSLLPEMLNEEDDGSGYILLRYTGEKDMAGKEVYEGDILESQVGGQLIEIRYGVYKAYCPADRAMMDSVGFYAVTEDYPEMPIGRIKEYGVVVGNIYENPGILTGAEAIPEDCYGEAAEE